MKRTRRIEVVRHTRRVTLGIEGDAPERAEASAGRRRAPPRRPQPRHLMARLMPLGTAHLMRKET